MSEMDGLTERIAEVLAAHQSVWQSTGTYDWVCDGCDFTYAGNTSGKSAAWATHQAERVRAVLGETSRHWQEVAERQEDQIHALYIARDAEIYRIARALALLEGNPARLAVHIRAILAGNEAP